MARSGERKALGSGLSTVTLRDVAAKAGVGVSTVARVVHGNGYVAQETRARVEKVMRDEGFRLNAVASGLKRRRAKTIGALLHETLPNPFFAEVALGIEHRASREGYRVLLYNARGSAAQEREGVEALLSHQVEGIVFATSLDPANVALAHDAGAVVVEVEKPLFGGGGSVVVDNYVGATAATRHLIDLGHREIGFIGEPLVDLESAERPGEARVVNERVGGYLDALADGGIQVDDSLVVVGHYYDEQGWSHLQAGREYMVTMLDQHPSVTAVFAGSDLLAAGALQALYARGIRVPDEMSVIGFDDTIATHTAPQLTTVRQPMFEMGQRAASLAMGRRQLKREVWLETELVTRGSTVPPRSH